MEASAIPDPVSLESPRNKRMFLHVRLERLPFMCQRLIIGQEDLEIIPLRPMLETSRADVLSQSCRVHLLLQLVGERCPRRKGTQELRRHADAYRCPAGSNRGEVNSQKTSARISRLASAWCGPGRGCTRLPAGKRLKLRSSCVARRKIPPIQPKLRRGELCRARSQVCIRTGSIRVHVSI